MLGFRRAYVRARTINRLFMNNKYKSTNHAKHLLQFHVIFVTKFRHPFLQNNKIDTSIKQILTNTAEKNHNIIHFIESDKDHIHFLIETIPTTNLLHLVNKLKQSTSYYTWHLLPNEIGEYYWNDKHFCWTRGYFISSIGNVSGDIVKEYILNQGKEDLVDGNNCN